MTEQKKRVITDIALTEISAVDEGANEHAKIVIIKSKDQKSKDKEREDEVPNEKKDDAKSSEDILKSLVSAIEKISERSDYIEKMLSLDDRERSYARGLSTEGRKEFISKSSDDRLSEMEQAKASDDDKADEDGVDDKSESKDKEDSEIQKSMRRIEQKHEELNKRLEAIAKKEKQIQLAKKVDPYISHMPGNKDLQRQIVEKALESDDKDTLEAMGRLNKQHKDMAKKLGTSSSGQGEGIRKDYNTWKKHYLEKGHSDQEARELAFESAQSEV